MRKIVLWFLMLYSQRLFGNKKLRDDIFFNLFSRFGIILTKISLTSRRVLSIKSIWVFLLLYAFFILSITFTFIKLLWSKTIIFQLTLILHRSPSEQGPKSNLHLPEQVKLKVNQDESVAVFPHQPGAQGLVCQEGGGGEEFNFGVASSHLLRQHRCREL